MMKTRRGPVHPSARARGRRWVALVAVASLWASGSAVAQFRVFVHQANASNTFLFSSTLDHPDLNGDPSVRFVVTQVFNPQGGLSGQQNAAHIGVRYSSSAAKWTIENQDLSTAIPVGARFFVFVSKDNGGPPDDGVLHLVTEDNTTGSVTLVDDAHMNSSDSGAFIATWVRNPGGGTGPALDDELIVRWDTTAGKWRVSTANFTALPAGGGIALAGVFADFDRQTLEPGAVQVGLHQANAGNSSAALTRIPGWTNPFDFVFVTQTVGTVVNESPLGTLYDTFNGTWAIYNVDDVDMPAGATFMALRFPVLFWDGFETGNDGFWSSGSP